MQVFVEQYWLILAVFAGAFLLIAFWISEDAPVARHVFFRFVFNIALPLIVIFGVPLFSIALSLKLDDRLWAAIVAGLVITAGWLTSAIFGELGKSRDKAEKLRDYHKALYAEIGNTLNSFYANGHAEEEFQTVVQNMEKDDNFVPIIPKENHDFVYNALIEHIEVLPRVTIDAIVAYYSLIKSLAAQAEDMRGKRFQGIDLDQNRRIAMYKDYFETRKNAFKFGQHALALISEYAKNGAEAAEKLSKKRSNPTINSQDAAPSDQLPESE